MNDKGLRQRWHSVLLLTPVGSRATQRMAPAGPSHWIRNEERASASRPLWTPNRTEQKLQGVAPGQLPSGALKPLKPG